MVLTTFERSKISTMESQLNEIRPIQAANKSPLLMLTSLV